MKMLVFILCFGASLQGHAQTETDQRIHELTRRIEELERQQDDLIIQSSSDRNNVHSFLRDNLTIGGFYETAFTAFQGPDTDLQAMNSANILGLNFAAEYNPRLRFVSQLLTGLIYPVNNPNNDPTPVPATQPAQREYGEPLFFSIITQGYVEYSINDHTRIQGGAGYVPFGFALQQRELVLFIRRGGPQLLRTGQLVTPLWGGLHLLGNYSLAQGEWGYNLYTANPLETSTDVAGVGGRVWWSSPSDRLTLGLSSQVGKYVGHTDEIVGTDAVWRPSWGMVSMEFAQHITEGIDPWTAYAEPSFFIYEDEVLLYVFGDYAHSTLPVTGVGQDVYQKWEYGTGVNWLPTSYTRLRTGVAINDYVGESAVENGQNRDAVVVDVSASVAF